MVQAVTFDFWNTVCVAVSMNEVRAACIQETVRQKGHTDISAARIERAIERAWGEWYRVWEEEQRTFGADRWVSLVLRELGVTLDLAAHTALVRAMRLSGMAARPPLVEGVERLLPRLASRYKLGLICDTGLSPGQMLRQWMAAQGILGYFDHLTFSDELGVSKPHPRAFLDTLEHLGVPPQAAVHVGDYPRTDIAGAKAVGMRAVRFTGVRDWPTDGVQADADIASLDELEALLAAWAQP